MSSRQRGGREREDQRRFPTEPPLVVNGWTLLVWPAFAERWTALRDLVAQMRSRDPEGYVHTPAAKFLQALRRLVLEEIPRDPASERFRQGLTLGKGNRHWRRAKFLRCFRLFFRYHSGERIVVYAWLNGEETLRKEDSRTDVYAVFEALLKHGTPPGDWHTLVAESRRWTKEQVG